MKHEWKDVFASTTESGLDVYFDELGSQFHSLYQTLQALPEMNFSLTSGQQLRFNQFFEKIQTLYIAIQEEDIMSSVRRLGLTAYRIMMIFSGLRIMETGEMADNIICDDVDFENTLQMVTVLIKHSSYVFTQIAQEVYKPKPKNRKEKFLERLPAIFNRQAYVSIALELNIPDKTAQRYIKEFVDAGLIIDGGYDKYLNQNSQNP